MRFALVPSWLTERDCHFLGFLGQRDVAGGDDLVLALDYDCSVLGGSALRAWSLRVCGKLQCTY